MVFQSKRPCTGVHLVVRVHIIFHQDRNPVERRTHAPLAPFEITRLGYLQGVRIDFKDRIDILVAQGNIFFIHQDKLLRCQLPFRHFLLELRAFGDQFIKLLLVRERLTSGLTEFDVHDVLNVFQCTGLNEEDRYFMKTCPAQQGVALSRVDVTRGDDVEPELSYSEETITQRQPEVRKN